jgi:hypothetical protein
MLRLSIARIAAMTNSCHSCPYQINTSARYRLEEILFQVALKQLEYFKSKLLMYS